MTEQVTFAPPDRLKSRFFTHRLTNPVTQRIISLLYSFRTQIAHKGIYAGRPRTEAFENEEIEQIRASKSAFCGYL
jgi:hypothetical protein